MGTRAIRAGTIAGTFLFLAAAPAASQSAGTVYRQGAGPDFVVAMEGEHAATLATGIDGRTWSFGSVAYPGYSGVGYLQVLPPGGHVLDAGYAAVNARVDFLVDFGTTGTHFVWIRGRTLPEPDDATSGTCHVGLDGTEVWTGERITGFAPSFGWSSQTLDLAPATLVVATTGVHTVSVYMREGGFCLDRVLLTRNAALVPTGTGPAESPQGLPTGAVLTPVSGPDVGDNPNGDDVINDRCASSAGPGPAGLGWCAAVAALALLALRR